MHLNLSPKIGPVPTRELSSVLKVSRTMVSKSCIWSRANNVHSFSSVTTSCRFYTLIHYSASALQLDLWLLKGPVQNRVAFFQYSDHNLTLSIKAN